MRTAILAIALALGLSVGDGRHAAAAERVYVVGDSLNDTGTFAPVTATGRFTTTPGFLWVEWVAEAYGLSAAPAYFFDGASHRRNEGGTNYAQSGALVTGEGGLYDGASKSVVWQVDRLLEDARGHLGGAVVLMNGGGPDVILAASAVSEGRMTPEQAAAHVETAGSALVAQAKRIEAAGPKRLVVLNVADLGAVPLFGAGQGEGAAFVTALSEAFNRALAEAAARQDLAAEMPDIFGFFNGMIADPAAFGFTNVTEPSVDATAAAPTPTGNSANSGPSHLVVANAARTYLFADAIHPSGQGHAHLASFVIDGLAAEPN